MPANAEQAPVALVVEDDEHIAHLLQFLFEREGFAVHALRDGAAGKAFIEQQPAPQVAVFDMMMPFHDGLELVRTVRAQAEWAQVPVLMLTSKSQELDIVRALEAGANDYVVKPFLPNELLARVRRLVQSVNRRAT